MSKSRKLPAPRLQFRWEPTESTGNWGANWICYYELILHVDKYDIRNPKEYKSDGEIALSISSTKVTSSRGPVFPDGKIDTPFRDGAHAIWDRAQLGYPPVYAICGKQHSLIHAAGEREADAMAKTNAGVV